METETVLLNRIKELSQQAQSALYKEIPENIKHFIHWACLQGYIRAIADIQGEQEAVNLLKRGSDNKFENLCM